MGYRVRLGKISKKDHEKYKDKTYEECLELFGEEEGEDRYFPACYIPEHTQLYEIGKYWDFEDETNGGKLTPFYAFDVYEKTEGEFYIMSKEQLKKIIEWYHDKTASYMQDMFCHAITVTGEGDSARIKRYKEEGLELSDDAKYDDPKNELVSFFFGMYQEWTRGKDYGIVPFYLDEPEKRRDGQVVRSWKFQYSILNLVYIYNTFDWENDYLIYSGW